MSTNFSLKPVTLPCCVRHQNPVGRGFQRRAHHRERMGELLGLPLQRFLRLDKLLLGTLTRKENAVGVLQRDRAQQLLFAHRLVH